MTLSVWRFAHLALAVISSLFLVMASVTGAILAIDAINERSNAYQITEYQNLNLSELIPILQKNYSEVSTIEIDHNQVVSLEAYDLDDNEVKAIIDPKTGKIIGKPQKKTKFIQWITSLHRSLFLHETGRIFIGINAFLLMLIAVSGIMLIIQRQRGLMRFFSKIVKDYFLQYYHVISGRLLLIPILMIAVTGTYLSLLRFNIFAEQKIEHKIPKVSDEEPEQKDLAQFPIFKNTKLSDVKKIELPFPDDPEEYFKLKLKDRELFVNQFNGEVVSNIPYSSTALLENLSLNLHTGRTNIVWAAILGIASLNILFFIFSGFAITFRRKSNKIKNKFKPEEAKIIILTGSENGSTIGFADHIHQQLLSSGYASFLTMMNNYRLFPNAEHFIILTSTYGLGDAPNNADHFLSLINEYPQTKKVNVSVVGFGSRSYSNFCGFAKDVDVQLKEQIWTNMILDLSTINEKSPEEFVYWVKEWSSKTGIELKTTPAIYNQKPKGFQKMMVLEKTRISENEHTFLLTLKPKIRSRFTSGDLLAINPADDYRERLYSIGKKDGNIQLKVKLHPNGLGSEFLNALKAGSMIKARIVENRSFHFPKKSNKVVMIANGTGIAPFLGMIHENKNKTECHLYSGFRNETEMIEKHRVFAENQINKRNLNSFHIAFSREQNYCYVMDLIERDADFFIELLQNNGTIMICGYLVMKKDVEKILDRILLINTNNNLEFYKLKGQLLTDCY